MPKGSEIVNAILKGLGRRPTRYVLRYSPTFKYPFRFDLLEVFRCETDGGLVTPTMSQASRPLHAGHHIKDPSLFSVWDVIKIQLRLVR